MPRDALRTRGRKVAVAIVTVAVMAAGVSVALTYTPLFAARHIRVEGNVVLGADRVVAAAGLEIGANVAHLDTGAVEARLLRNPWVAAASVERDLPGTIRIRIHEREPVASLLDGVVVAGDGTVLPHAPSRGLPEIRPTYGELAAEAATGAAGALAAMSSPLRQLVSAVVVQPDGTLFVQLRAGIEVDYGMPTDLVAKGASLQALLRWAEEEGSELMGVDVSVPAAPTATLTGGSTDAA